MTDDETRYEARQAAALTRELAAVLARLADNAPHLIEDGQADWLASLRPHLCHLLDTITEGDE